MAADLFKNVRAAGSPASLVALCALLGACSSLLDLDALKRVDCTDDCSASGSEGGGASGGRATSSGGVANGVGAKPNGGSPTSTTGGKPSAGSSTLGGMNSSGSATTPHAGDAPVEAGAGGAGETLPSGPCPGGPAPPQSWKEHWSGHTEALTLRDYDECIAVYVDSGMAGTDTAWLSQFLTSAWTYNLTTYGKLGEGRLFVVLHLGKYLGGHAAAEYDATHDNRSTIDVGANTWTAGNYDLVATELSALVERSAVPGKQGSPASADWGADGFAQIYKYDLYTGLGMTAEASAAVDAFSPTPQSYPAPNSYWFYDFYYPLWKDHGRSKLLSGFFGELGKYYPAPGGLMAPMNWGQYIHFLSGAAGLDLQAQATYAFGWNATWTAQLKQARSDFPAITY